MADKTAPVWKTETIKLNHPIAVEGGEPIKEVELREPDVEALETIEASGMLSEGGTGANLTIKQMRICIEALSGLPTETVRKIHASDFTRLGESFVPLLDSFLTDNSDPEPSTE